MNYLSGLTVVITCIFTIYCFHSFMFTLRIKTSLNDNKDISTDLLHYKNKMTLVFLFAFICFFSLSVFGYLYNCIFLSWKARVSGVQQYITFFILYAFLEYFVNRKEKYKIKKAKLNIKKFKLVLIMLTICLISTIISVFVR